MGYDQPRGFFTNKELVRMIQEHEATDAIAVPVQSALDKSLALAGQIGSGKPYFWTSLPMVTNADKRRVVQYQLDKENGIDDILDPKSFSVKDCIIMQASFNDAEKGPVTLPKAILIDEEGKSISILAGIWVKEFIALFPVFGMPPWDEPIIVSAKRVKGSGANKYYTLHLP